MSNKKNAFALLADDDEDIESKYVTSQAQSAKEKAKETKASSSAKAAAARPPSLIGGSGSGAGSTVNGASSSRAAVPAQPAAPRAFNQDRPRADYNNREMFRKSFQNVYVDNHGLAAVLRLHETDILKVKANGDVILNATSPDGRHWYSTKTMASMNDVLQLFDMHVETAEHPVTLGRWKVHDGHGTLYRFADNMLVPAKDPEDRKRAQTLLEHYGVAVPQWLRPRALQPVAPAALAAPAPKATVTPGINFAAAAARANAGAAGPTANGTAARVGAAPVQQLSAMAPLVSFDSPATCKAAEASLQNVVAQLQQMDVALEDQHLEGVADEDICLVCFNALRNVVLVPCGHMVLCKECFDDLMQADHRQCPTCRSDITDHVEC